MNVASHPTFHHPCAKVLVALVFFSNFNQSVDGRIQRTFRLLARAKKNGQNVIEIK